MQDAVAAFRFLTAVRYAEGEPLDARRVGRGAVYFPAIGLILGLALRAADRVTALYLPSEILALVLVLLLASMTGGQHLASAQEFFGGGPGKRGEAAPSKLHTRALLALLFILLFKLRAVEIAGESLRAALLLTPALARWALLLLLFGSGASANDDARRMAEEVRPWHLILATAGAVGVAFFVAGPVGLWIALCQSLFALLARAWALSRTDGITWAGCGAFIEVSEALAFSLFATL